MTKAKVPWGGWLASIRVRVLAVVVAKPSSTTGAVGRHDTQRSRRPVDGSKSSTTAPGSTQRSATRLPWNTNNSSPQQSLSRHKPPDQLSTTCGQPQDYLYGLQQGSEHFIALEKGVRPIATLAGITSPVAGTVKRIAVDAVSQVQGGDLLMVVKTS